MNFDIEGYETTTVKRNFMWTLWRLGFVQAWEYNEFMTNMLKEDLNIVWI